MLECAGREHTQVLKASVKSMSKLTGKIALVTGGSSGIGLAAAQKFADEEAFVFIAARRNEELEKAKTAIGRNVIAVQTDVTKMEDPNHLFSVIKNEKGNLDIVFAKFVLARPWEVLPEPKWRRLSNRE
jgi:NAD(P)-dependent dehydrogenase (short-subunit alcohol dehydrogenase family)